MREPTRYERIADVVGVILLVVALVKFPGLCLAFADPKEWGRALDFAAYLGGSILSFLVLVLLRYIGNGRKTKRELLLLALERSQAELFEHKTRITTEQIRVFQQAEANDNIRAQIEAIRLLLSETQDESIEKDKTIERLTQELERLKLQRSQLVEVK
jgi:hypothetical protein